MEPKNGTPRKKETAIKKSGTLQEPTDKDGVQVAKDYGHSDFSLSPEKFVERCGFQYRRFDPDIREFMYLLFIIYGPPKVVSFRLGPEDPEHSAQCKHCDPSSQMQLHVELVQLLFQMTWTISLTCPPELQKEAMMTKARQYFEMLSVELEGARDTFVVTLFCLCCGFEEPPPGTPRTEFFLKLNYMYELSIASKELCLSQGPGRLLFQWLSNSILEALREQPNPPAEDNEAMPLMAASALPKKKENKCSMARKKDTAKRRLEIASQAQMRRLLNEYVHSDYQDSPRKFVNDRGFKYGGFDQSIAEFMEAQHVLNGQAKVVSIAIARAIKGRYVQLEAGEMPVEDVTQLLFQLATSISKEDDAAHLAVKILEFREYFKPLQVDLRGVDDAFIVALYCLCCGFDEQQCGTDRTPRVDLFLCIKYLENGTKCPVLASKHLCLTQGPGYLLFQWHSESILQAHKKQAKAMPVRVASKAPEGKNSKRNKKKREKMKMNSAQEHKSFKRAQDYYRHSQLLSSWTRFRRWCVNKTLLVAHDAKRNTKRRERKKMDSAQEHKSFEWAQNHYRHSQLLSLWRRFRRWCVNKTLLVAHLAKTINAIGAANTFVCPICFTASSTFVPMAAEGVGTCGHVICGGCVDRLKTSGNANLCPTCRAPYRSFAPIFFAMGPDN